MARVGYERKTIDAPPMASVDEPDWAQLIEDICAQRVPKKQIAERCDMHRQVLYSIINGASVPYWRQGQLLIDLHKKVVPAAPKKVSLLGATLCQM